MFDDYIKALQVTEVLQEYLDEIDEVSTLAELSALRDLFDDDELMNTAPVINVFFDPLYRARREELRDAE